MNPFTKDFYGYAILAIACLIIGYACVTAYETGMEGCHLAWCLEN